MSFGTLAIVRGCCRQKDRKTACRAEADDPTIAISPARDTSAFKITRSERKMVVHRWLRRTYLPQGKAVSAADGPIDVSDKFHKTAGMIVILSTAFTEA
jgi:hypothetical protein